MEAAEARELCRTLFWKNPSGGQEGGGGGRGCGCRACVGASILGDAGMKGWALAASLDPWYSLADPPLSQLGLWGPRFRKQFFPTPSVQRYFVCLWT